MRRAALVPFDVTKEIRGLAGAWLACLTALILPAAMGVRATRGLEIPAYLLGVAALGALSIGHEYTHSTLTLLLSQPRSRARLFLVKQGVLAAMLLTLAAVAGAVVDVRARESATLAFALLPVLCGLFVAPWLTMLCRSPLAGTVFAVALPALLLIVSELLYVATYGRGPGAEVEMTIVWRTTLGLCAVAAVMSWRMFMRLESIDGRGPEVQLPSWLQGRNTTSIAALTKRRPVWLLIKKELWLQQTALAVAALWLLCLPLVWIWVGDWGAGQSIQPAPLWPRTPNRADVLGALTLFYSAFISMLIGALASAEERRLGTLEWQVLLPVATWKQWIIKVGTALGLALLLALGLPGLLLAAVDPAAGIQFLQRNPQLAGGVAVLTLISLYVSSLCTSGLQALLISLPVIFGVVLPAGVVAAWRGSYGLHSVVAARRSAEKAWASVGMSLDAGGRLMSLLELLLVAAILAVALRFALGNHRSTAHAGRRVWTQVIVMSICAIVGALLLTGMAALS
jgi:hypothetical protein